MKIIANGSNNTFQIFPIAVQNLRSISNLISALSFPFKENQRKIPIFIKSSIFQMNSFCIEIDGFVSSSKKKS